ncbi:MAG TPA: tetratricopeptide repeat protein [Candidatus Binatia bacterium]|nr:tetratricopeptide repeat protein [Candidatus Binatia bacterium]
MSQISRKIMQGQRDEAMALLDKAIAEHPQEAKWFLARGRLRGTMDQPEKAIEDFNAVINIDTNMARAFHERGWARFKLGQFKESVADFDQFLKLQPDFAPEHWQRGIALYYAGEYERGRNQFEAHQKVNPRDVENAVWHFLCVARLNGVEKAKASLIPVQGDTRVPMKEIHALFAGKAKPEDVLAAARQPGELFYAHLYLGLYYAAYGDKAKAGEHIDKAATEFHMNNYMGDVARVHAALFKKGQ